MVGMSYQYWAMVLVLRWSKHITTSVSMAYIIHNAMTRDRLTSKQQYQNVDCSSVSLQVMMHQNDLQIISIALEASIMTFLPGQRIHQQIDLVKVPAGKEMKLYIEVYNMLRGWSSKILNNLPNSILNKFGTLTGTLNSRIPAREIGILFNDPTRLQKTNQDPS